MRTESSVPISATFKEPTLFSLSTATPEALPGKITSQLVRLERKGSNIRCNPVFNLTSSHELTANRLKEQFTASTTVISVCRPPIYFRS